MQPYRVAYLAVDDEPLAVFLDSGPDCNPGNLMTYARVGEHGEASVEFLEGLAPAGEAQYRSLHRYLAQRYAQGPGDPLDLQVAPASFGD